MKSVKMKMIEQEKEIGLHRNFQLINSSYQTSSGKLKDGRQIR